jgi:hypothetical protein
MKSLPLHAMEELEGKCYSSYTSLTSALEGVSGQRQLPAALHPPEKNHKHPIDKRLGGFQRRSADRG